MEAIRGGLGVPRRVGAPPGRQLPQPDDLSRPAGHYAFTDETVTDPPHDHPDQPAADHLPRRPERATQGAMKNGVLGGHPVNQARIKAGNPPASAIWLWGRAGPPACPSSRSTALKGAIISAVDLVRGVGVLAGWARDRCPGRDRIPRHRLRRQRPVRHTGHRKV